MNLKGIGLLDDKKWKGIIKMGYEQTHAYLKNLPDQEKFWFNPSKSPSTQTFEAEKKQV